MKLNDSATTARSSYSWMTKLAVMLMMLFAFLPSALAQNTGTMVTGVVSDENGDPLIGALVSVDGTSKATATDVDGRFSLQVPANTPIRISYIGYKSCTVTPVAGQPVNVQLAIDNNVLDEVVVVGYGTMKKSDLTGAIAGVKGTDIAARRSTNLSDALQGAVVGSDGKP